MLLDNSSFITNERKMGNIFLKSISLFNDDFDALAKKFINKKTFPYVNTAYNKLFLETDELSKKQIDEIISILSNMFSEFEKAERKYFENLDNENFTLEYGIEKSKCSVEDMDKIFDSIKGGYLCEMMLYNILIELGYEKIISKLYLVWNEFSPTGIDVPCINFNKKSLVLGECKFYRTLKAAITSCAKDIISIYNSDRLDIDINNWHNKITMVPDDVYDFLVDKKIKTKEDFLLNVDEIISLGFIIVEHESLDDIEKELLELGETILKSKEKIVLYVIPIKSKNALLNACYKRITNLKEEFSSGR